MVSEQTNRTQLILTFEAGLDDEGEMTYRRRTFNNVHFDATSEQLFQTATGLASLQMLSIYSIERSATSYLVSE